jgi:putative endonuclease
VRDWEPGSSINAVFADSEGKSQYRPIISRAGFSGQRGNLAFVGNDSVVASGLDLLYLFGLGACNSRSKFPLTWFVYVVRCADDSLYTGIARDVTARIRRHNAGHGARYTRARLPVTLVHTETAADRSEAQRREYQIRRLPAARKRELVARAPGPTDAE